MKKFILLLLLVTVQVAFFSCSPDESSPEPIPPVVIGEVPATSLLKPAYVD